MKKSESNLVSVKDIAEVTNLSIATIDHYIDLGLINIAKRQGTQRLFDCPACCKRIKLIQELLNKGISLRQIKQQLNGSLTQHMPSVNTPNLSLKRFLTKRNFVLLILLSCSLAVLSFAKGR